MSKSSIYYLASIVPFKTFLCYARELSRVESSNHFICRFLSVQILVAQKVTAGVYKGVTTSELDELAAETSAALTSTHPDYATVSCRFFNLNSSVNLRRISIIYLQRTLIYLTACCSYCRLQPSQEHPEVLHRDVSLCNVSTCPSSIFLMPVFPMQCQDHVCSPQS